MKNKRIPKKPVPMERIWWKELKRHPLNRRTKRLPRCGGLHLGNDAGSKFGIRCRSGGKQIHLGHGGLDEGKEQCELGEEAIHDASLFRDTRPLFIPSRNFGPMVTI